MNRVFQVFFAAINADLMHEGSPTSWDAHTFQLGKPSPGSKLGNDEPLSRKTINLAICGGPQQAEVVLLQTTLVISIGRTASNEEGRFHQRLWLPAPQGRAAPLVHACRSLYAAVLNAILDGKGDAAVGSAVIRLTDAGLEPTFRPTTCGSYAPPIMGVGLGEPASKASLYEVRAPDVSTSATKVTGPSPRDELLAWFDEVKPEPAPPGDKRTAPRPPKKKKEADDFELPDAE